MQFPNQKNLRVVYNQTKQMHVLHSRNYTQGVVQKNNELLATTWR